MFFPSLPVYQAALGGAGEPPEEGFLGLVGLDGGVVPCQDERGLGRVVQGVALVQVVKAMMLVGSALLLGHQVTFMLGGVGVRVRGGRGVRVEGAAGAAVLGAVGPVAVARRVAAVAGLADLAA